MEEMWEMNVPTTFLWNVILPHEAGEGNAG